MCCPATPAKLPERLGGSTARPRLSFPALRSPTPLPAWQRLRPARPATFTDALQRQGILRHAQNSPCGAGGSLCHCGDLGSSPSPLTGWSASARVNCRQGTAAPPSPAAGAGLWSEMSRQRPRESGQPTHRPDSRPVGQRSPPRFRQIAAIPAKTAVLHAATRPLVSRRGRASSSGPDLGRQPGDAAGEPRAQDKISRRNAGGGRAAVSPPPRARCRPRRATRGQPRGSGCPVVLPLAAHSSGFAVDGTGPPRFTVVAPPPPRPFQGLLPRPMRRALLFL